MKRRGKGKKLAGVTLHAGLYEDGGVRTRGEVRGTDDCIADITAIFLRDIVKILAEGQPNHANAQILRRIADTAGKGLEEERTEEDR